MCEHSNFDAKVIIKRSDAPPAWRASLRVTCKQCGMDFYFPGLPPEQPNGIQQIGVADHGTTALLDIRPPLTSTDTGSTPPPNSVRRN